jgi:hypothetical protein
MFVKEPVSFHPTEGMLIHPYDEILAFASLNLDDILDLGAEVSVEIGEERETYTFNETSMICIPAGTPHGPVKVKKVETPIVHFTISLAPEYKAVHIPEADLKEPIPGSKYEDHVRLMVGTFDPVLNMPIRDAIELQKTQGITGSRSLDERGVRHPQRNQHMGFVGPGNADNLLWLYGHDCLGFELNFLFSHCTKCGIWHRGGTSHAHPEEEILILAGLDPDHPLEMGAEQEVAMGPDDERYAINVPTILVMPRGFPHLPQVTRWVDKPYAFMCVNPDPTHGTPWKDNSGGKVEDLMHDAD